MKKEINYLKIFAFAIVIIGAVFLGSWTAALGVFFMIWANNIVNFKK